MLAEISRIEYETDLEAQDFRLQEVKRFAVDFDESFSVLSLAISTAFSVSSSSACSYLTTSYSCGF